MDHSQIYSDFNTIILHGKGAHLKAKARREGKTESVKKAQNKEQAIKMAKLSDDTLETKVKRIDPAISKLISQKRTAKKITQKQLANSIPMPQNELQKYENGTAIPNMKYILAIQKRLGVKLTGKISKK